MRRPSILAIYCWLLLAFLFAPILTLILFSFDASGRGTLPLNDLSTHWYEEVLDSPLIRAAFGNSLIVAAATTVSSVILGTLAALAFFRRRSRLNAPITVLAVLPIALPPLVLGIALLSLFKAMGITLSLTTVTIAHVLLTAALVLLVVNARLANFDRSIEDAARDLGATPVQTFRKVTFPLIRSSVFGAMLLVLAISLDEFIVTLFTIGPDNTVPVVIWGQMRRGISPTVNAISAILLTVTVAVVLLTRWLAALRVGSSRRE
jgi:ABC-type spermidine/putrescine transport system permease subunit II